ncbi:MAG: hypothetical protein LBT99_02590 [Bifidobacteriaceae bacterium]|jgi:ComF family protein|nr:hypothetical protein [Bifidobacteriaceae bacterium]
MLRQFGKICQKYFKEFLLLIFPLNCAGCGKWDVSVCKQCYKAISTQPFLSNRFSDYNIWVANNYNIPIKPIILQWKDHARKDLNKIIIKRIMHAFTTANWQKISPNLILVPIPSTKKAIRQRGFCQTKTLAHAIANNWQNITVRNLLIKKGGMAAHKLTKKQTRHAEFYLNKSNYQINQLANSTPVVLIDDVVTTGNTIIKCQQILEQNNYKVIGTAVIAEAN